jgi:protein TonB
MSDNRGAAKTASTYAPPGGQGGGTYSDAGYRFGALPAYPDSERTSGREGVVTVRVLVGKDGRPVSVVVRNTSGHADFDNAALEAVRKWKFFPARRGGIAVAGFFDVRVRFHLDDAGLMTRR